MVHCLNFRRQTFNMAPTLPLKRLRCSLDVNEADSSVSSPVSMLHRRKQANPARYLPGVRKHQSSTPTAFQVLRKNVENVTTPASLFRQSAKATARLLRSQDALLPSCMFMLVKLAVLAFLTPSLLLRFIKSEGGIVKLAQKCGQMDFQVVMNKILVEMGKFEVSRDIYNQLHRQAVLFETYLASKIYPEHGFYRLGLYTRVQRSNDESRWERYGAQLYDAHENMEELPQQPICNITLYKFYSGYVEDRSQMIPGFVLPPLPQQLLQWMSKKQTRFQLSPLKLNQHTPWPTALDEAGDSHNLDLFLAHDLHDQVLKILSRISNMLKFNRVHGALLLCFQLLLSDQWLPKSPVLVQYKMYIYEALAISLSVMQFPINVVAMVIQKMEQHHIYPRDEYWTLLTKQRIYGIYGMFDYEKDLFDKLYLENTFPGQSRLFKRCLSGHVAQVLRACQVSMVEVWCERQYHSQCFKFICQETIIDPVFVKLRGQLKELELLLHRVQSMGTISPTTRTLLKFLSILQQLYYGLAGVGQRWTYNTGYKCIQTAIASAELFLPNLSISISMILRHYINRMSSTYFVDHYLDSLKTSLDNQDDRADWCNSLMRGNVLFEHVAVLLMTGTEKTHKQIVKSVVEEAIMVYEALSCTFAFHRLSILKKVKQFLDDGMPLHRYHSDAKVQPLVPAPYKFMGLTQKEVNRNTLKFLMPDPVETETVLQSDYNVLKYIFNQDQQRLKDCLRFGQQSLLYNKTT